MYSVLRDLECSCTRSCFSARSRPDDLLERSSTIRELLIEVPPGLLDGNEGRADIRVHGTVTCDLARPHRAVVCRLKHDEWRIGALDKVRAEAIGMGPMMNRGISCAVGSTSMVGERGTTLTGRTSHCRGASVSRNA